MQVLCNDDGAVFGSLSEYAEHRFTVHGEGHTCPRGGSQDDPGRYADDLLALLGPEDCQRLLYVWEAWGEPFESRPEATALRTRLDKYAREEQGRQDVMTALAVNPAHIAATMGGVA